jgi:hypothetical protein
MAVTLPLSYHYMLILKELFFNFLENYRQRGNVFLVILIVTEFFARYGKLNYTQVKLCFFHRQTSNFGCEKIEDKFCICFVPDVTETDIAAIKQAIRAFRGESPKEGSFLLMRDRDLLIVTEFFARYGNLIRN